jgi:hypothetical protein
MLGGVGGLGGYIISREGVVALVRMLGGWEVSVVCVVVMLPTSNKLFPALLRRDMGEFGGKSNSDWKREEGISGSSA